MLLSELNKISNSEINKKLLSSFLIKFRNMVEDNPREQLLKELGDRGVILIPSDDYIDKAFGRDMRLIFEEYYDNSKCTLSKTVSIPVTTLKGNILGFIQNVPSSNTKYKYPDSLLMKKSRYIQMSNRSFQKALSEDYVVLVEGVFDELSVASLGEPCMALGGSELNKETASIINVIDNKIIISDNDNAGFKMYTQCKKLLKGNVVSIKVPTKDIDEYLRNEVNRIDFLKMIEEQKKSNWVSSFVKVGF